jgi:N-acetylmuramoyl-L-alanine amidase-like
MQNWRSLKIFLQNLRKRNLQQGERLVQIGLHFLNKPYEANPLEDRNREKLICSLDQFDCLTFVETVLALNAVTKSGILTKDKFLEKLKLIRYRAGIIDGYASRLHYTLEWLADNERKKILRNITSQLPAALPFKKEINFMSAHRSLYQHLADPQTFYEIVAIEKRISRKKYFYLQKEKFSLASSQIQDGDIIAFSAVAEGLDIAHIGFAFYKKGKLKLLHASQKEGKVVLSTGPLERYLIQNKKVAGIVVARVRS